MGKLRRIKEEYAELKANVKLVTEKLEKFEQLENTLLDLQTKFNEIYTIFMTPDEEVSEADMIKQQEEVADQMKIVVRNAISDMINDPENQKAIQTFMGQFSASMSGQAGGLPFDLEAISDKDGNLDLLKAGFMWLANRGKGDGAIIPQVTGGKKRTSY